jgi:hypothetical protein
MTGLLPQGAWRRAAPYLLIAVATILLFCWLGKRPGERVGDGSEYYAMFYAWDEGQRPWMDSAANAAYDKLQRSTEVVGLVPRPWFYEAFSELRVGNTTDFNHFWFYSLLALVCQKLAMLLGIKLSIHASFLALHGVLIGTTVAAAYHYYRLRGMLVMLLLIFASPLLWYLDKVHTEPFTLCLLFIGMMQMHRARYAAAAWLFALVSTQNPSFALIAGIPWAYRVLLQWRQRFSGSELLLLALAAVTVLLHPLYYEMRYGVVTPQLLAGGAALGSNLSSFYVWILDPDLGLLPNWPLGTAALLAAGALWYWRRRFPQAQPAAPRQGSNWPEAAFLLAYVLINFYAQSSTSNLNSGATPGLARYALWYMPLAFSLLLWISAQCPWRTARGYALALGVLLLTGAALQRYNPHTPEQYVTPSRLSYLLQSKLPTWYNPAPEIFMERYSGHGEERAYDLIVGPDCRKMLLIYHVNTPGAMSPNRCLFDNDKLSAYRRAVQAQVPQPYGYVYLSDAQAMGMLLSVSPAPYKLGLQDSGGFVLGRGWGQQEPWGVWSVGKRAELNFPCSGEQFYRVDQPFDVALKMEPYGQQALTLRAGEQVLWQGPVRAGGADIRFTVPPSNCKQGVSQVVLEIANPTRPSDDGKSGDNRALGVSLFGLQFLGQTPSL